MTQSWFQRGFSSKLDAMEKKTKTNMKNYKKNSWNEMIGMKNWGKVSAGVNQFSTFIKKYENKKRW